MPHDGRPSILVVDDDRALCAVLLDVLTAAGYAVECAFDGEAGWAEIQFSPPHLVLSDITMPRLDGLGLVRRLRQDGSIVPVILMSAGDGDGAAALGVTFVRKPIDLDRMVSLVADLIAPPHADGPAETWQR